jgi:type I restriction enzyme S subunit
MKSMTLGVPLASLGEIARIQKGSTITAKSAVRGEVPVIAGGTKPAYFHHESNREANAITVSASGAAGYVSFHPYPIYASDCITVESLDLEVVDQRYLFFALLSMQDYLYSLSRGTALQHVYAKDLKPLKIPVPLIDDQRRIVSALDNHLSRLDKALAQLSRVTRLSSNFKESFTHGIVSGQYSDNLSKWQATKLGQVAKWSSGGTPQSGNPKYYGGSIPWCVIGDLTESAVSETAKTITEEGLAASSAKIVNPGTVLLAMYGASIGRTGMAGIPMATNQAIACAVPIASLDPSYLLLYLQSQKRMFIESGKGGAQPNISQTIIKDWEINLPPIDEQKRLLRLAKSFQATAENLNELMRDLEEKYESLRKSLLNAAFTGGLAA